MQFRQRRQQHLNNVFYMCILSKQQIMQFVFRKYLWSFCKHHTIFVKTKQTILVKWLRAQALDVFEGWVAWLRNFREDEESGIIAFQKQNVACCLQAGNYFKIFAARFWKNAFWLPKQLQTLQNLCQWNCAFIKACVLHLNVRILVCKVCSIPVR